MWPVGARSINYRWETPDGTAYQYLYLQANPVVWGLGLLGVIASISFLLSSFCLHLRLKHRPELITFLGMYLAYMFVVSQFGRVMYLYHYFIPLVFSFLLFAIVLMECRRFGRWKIAEWGRTLLALACSIFIFLAFEAYRPFTYYEPLQDSQVQHRSLLQLWDLKCVNCSRNNPIVRPR
jgi:dolichyl-phosphate-mannose--protein O-mannosyl transferase